MTGRERRKKQRRVLIERRGKNNKFGEKVFDNDISISEHTLKKSFIRALRGISLVINTQRNFVIEIFLFLLVIILSLSLKITISELIQILSVGGLVLVSEILNTSIEYIIDSFHKNDFNVKAKKAKDVASGAVLLSCMFATIIALIIFIPKF